MIVSRSIMLFHLLMLLQLLSGGQMACMRRLLPKHEGSQDQEVFVNDGEANSFLGRHLLFNRFDFEMFVPGNLERECYEEICNYEEAREVFENIPATNDFWKKYTDDQGQGTPRIDVISLLVGIISAAVALIIISILIWYFCHGKCKSDLSHRSSIRARPRRSNASIIMQRFEEVSLHPVLPPVEPPDLPSYEQAISRSGQHDAPPPPYPGSRLGSARR